MGRGSTLVDRQAHEEPCLIALPIGEMSVATLQRLGMGFRGSGTELETGVCTLGVELTAIVECLTDGRALLPRIRLDVVDGRQAHEERILIALPAREMSAAAIHHLLMGVLGVGTESEAAF